eukprot:TRINITY_DN17308_c0_g1_i1.p2 TRINITY_DN17308_c0_g1~~TRINITY_DN17308_c0_g1_i1.p2  ORF type:complete len:179 (-),score=72.66 TRINITY_DN17308_c0_g1_i1:174-710(-)
MCIRDSINAEYGTFFTVTMGKVKQAALSDNDLVMLKEAFELFDTDKSGAIDAEELKFCMQALEFTPTDAEIASMIGEIDGDGNFTIEYQEFVDLMASKMASRDPEQDLKKGFAFFDRDGKGYITAADLKIVAADMGNTELVDNGPELQQIIDEVESSAGSGVSYADFGFLMKRHGIGV